MIFASCERSLADGTQRVCFPFFVGSALDEIDQDGDGLGAHVIIPVSTPSVCWVLPSGTRSVGCALPCGILAGKVNSEGQGVLFGGDPKKTESFVRLFVRFVGGLGNFLFLLKWERRGAGGEGTPRESERSVCHGWICSGKRSDDTYEPAVAFGIFRIGPRFAQRPTSHLEGVTRQVESR